MIESLCYKNKTQITGGETTMNKKKIVATLGLGTMALGILFGAGTPIQKAEASTPETLENYKQRSTEHNKGEKPVHVYKDAQTGVYIEVYAVNPAERGLLMKEQNWKENDSIEVTGKDAKPNKDDLKIEKALQGLTTGFIKNFGTIKAEAGTDTSGWDLVGTEYWLMYADIVNQQRDTTWHSHGGDYSFVLPAHSAYSSPQTSDWGTAVLWDNDGGVSADDRIGQVDYSPSSYERRYTYTGMSAWLDGAELEPYTVHQQTYAPYGNSLSNVRYYD